MKYQNGALAPIGSACPEKATEVFYVVHSKALKPLLGPFLSAADAECGRMVMRSAGAKVEGCTVSGIDTLNRRHALNNGRVCRAFAGAASQGGQA